MKKSTYIILGAIVGLILLNVLSNRFSLRLDFTADQRYTLSKVSKDILKNVEEPINIKAYFTEDLPPQLLTIKNDFRDILTEYKNRSKGKINFEFINPNENQDTEKEAIQKGIAPNIVDIREKDQATQKKVFLGAIIEIGDSNGLRFDVIPVVNPAEMEYTLTKSIKRLTGKNKPTIGFSIGHGEAPMQEMQRAAQELGVLYKIENVDLSTNENIDVNALAIISPNDSFSVSDLKKIDKYVADGGSVFIGIDRVFGEMQNSRTAIKLNTGLETWLFSKGIQVDTNVVIDQQCTQVQVPIQEGLPFMNNVDFPYIPIIMNFGDHPAVQGFEGLFLEFPSEVSVIAQKDWTVTPLLYSSNRANRLPVPVFFEVEKRWSDADFPLVNLVTGLAIDGKISGDTPSKMIVIGDGGFAKGQFGENQDNVNLLVNGMSWLLNDTELNQLRTKAIPVRPINQNIDDTAKVFIKWTSFLFPLILVLVLGFVRMQRKKALRLHRMKNV
jgi:gliding-associated putative ABC transporter substrate-binding component GldG